MKPEPKNLVKPQTIGFKLFCLSAILIVALVALGMLSWMNSSRLGYIIDKASQSLREVVDDSSIGAGNLMNECHDLQQGVVETNIEGEKSREKTLSALAETACKLMDRRLDNAKFLTDACVNSLDAKTSADGFWYIEQVESGVTPVIPDETGSTATTEIVDRFKEDHSKLEDFFNNYNTLAGANFYAVVGLDGPLKGKVTLSNNVEIFNLDLNKSTLFSAVIKENKTVKGYDLFGRNLSMAAATIIKNAKGKGVAVLFTGYIFDNATARFLSDDLGAKLALFLPGKDGGYKLAYSTVVGSDGKVSKAVPLDDNTLKDIQDSLNAERAKAGGTAIDLGTLRKKFKTTKTVSVAGLQYTGAYQAILTESGNIGGILFVGRDATEELAMQEGILTRSKEAIAKAEAIEAGWKINPMNFRGEKDLVKRNSESKLQKALLVADESQSVLKQTKFAMAFGIVIAIFVSIVVSWYMTKSIQGPLYKIIVSLSGTSEEIARSSGQIFASSHTLAEGASEQAASIEQSSASLTEISSTIEHNAQTSQETRLETRKARQAAEVGAQSTHEMNLTMGSIKVASEEMRAAMDSISAASKDISNIIKTIDEIAFQTNLLALNAAVEAARAGEAGAGFAVVADEVRSLAQRSANAAKETAVMIETAVSRSESGVHTNQKVIEAVGGMVKQSENVANRLNEIVEKVQRVDQHVSQIAEASKEQSQAIGQISSAVNEMEKVTQSNASGAEESAAASQELNTQAAILRNAIAELQQLVGGGASNPVPAPKEDITKMFDRVDLEKTKSDTLQS